MSVNGIIKRIYELEIELNDEDGYPTEQLLEFIETLDLPMDTQNVNDLMQLVKNLWSYPDRALNRVVNHHGTPKMKYTFSTGGWSGNESLINSLLSIQFFKMFYLDMWKSGGYYEFLIPTDEPLPAPREVDLLKVRNYLEKEGIAIEGGDYGYPGLVKVIEKASQNSGFFFKEE